MLTDLRRAWTHVKAAGVGPVILAKTFWGAGGGYLVLISVLGSTRFGDPTGADTGAAGFATGMLYAARGLGTGLGPVLGRRFLGDKPASLLRQIAAGFFIAAAGYSALPFTSGLWSACGCVLLAHMGGSSIWVASTTFWQLRVANEFRGRAFALEFLGMTLSFTAGGFLAGAFYDSTGDADAALWFTSAAVAVMGLAWMFSARRVSRASLQS